MSPITVEILIILALILANGIFSMSEMAIVSARKARLQQLANQGSLNAQAALELAEAPNHFLSIVQVGITLINILNGVFGGATIAQRLEKYVELVPFLSDYSQTIAFGVVVLVITYLSLIVGELVPKRLALNNPEKNSCFYSYSYEGFSQFGFSYSIHVEYINRDRITNFGY